MDVSRAADVVLNRWFDALDDVAHRQRTMRSLSPTEETEEPGKKAPGTKVQEKTVEDRPQENGTGSLNIGNLLPMRGGWTRF